MVKMKSVDTKFVLSAAKMVNQQLDRPTHSAWILQYKILRQTFPIKKFFGVFPELFPRWTTDGCSSRQSCLKVNEKFGRNNLNLIRKCLMKYCRMMMAAVSAVSSPLTPSFGGGINGNPPGPSVNTVIFLTAGFVGS